MNPLQTILAKIGGFLIVVLVAGFGGYHLRGQLDDGATAKAEVKDYSQAQQQTQAKENTNAQLDQKYQADKARLVASNSALNAELARLRDTLANSKGSDAAPTSGADDTRIRELFHDSAGEVARLASEADRLATKVTGLQGYVTNICLN